jgi:hypothetical protein
MEYMMTIKSRANDRKPGEKDFKTSFKPASTNHKVIKAWINFARTARDAKPSVRESDQ